MSGTGVATTYKTFKERAAAPSTPPSTYDRLYFTSAGPYYVNSAGTASPIMSGFIAGYAADAGSNDTYVITLSPAPTAYAAGMVIHFKANTANTGAATLNVNALGAKNILKNHDQTLADGDIEANQIVTVVYDGTQFQMQSQPGTALETGDLAAPGAIGGTTPAAGTFTTVTANTGVTMGDAAIQTWDIAPASNNGFTGDVESVTAGATVALRDVLYLNSADSEWYLADADALSTMPAMRMAVGSGTDGNAVNTISRGVVRYDSWTWTPGQPIYVSTTGTTTNTLTQTAPSGDLDVIQIVGYALTATVMYFDPSPITVEIGLDIEDADAGKTVTMAELSAVPKTFLCTTGSAGDKTFGFGTPVAADIGKEWIVIKEDAGGTGKIIIDAPDGVTMSRAADTSSAGGTYTSEASKFQMIHLKVISATQIYVMDADGTWTGA